MMYIKYYDNVGELGSISLSNGELSSIDLPTGEYVAVSTEHRPFYNYVADQDIFYVKAVQDNAFTIALGKYVIDSISAARSIDILHIISSYGTLDQGLNTEIYVQNNNSLSDRIASNALFVESTNNFVPEILTSDYVVSLSGSMIVTLPEANVDNVNLKYGFYISDKYQGTDTLTIAASGSDSIISAGGEVSSVVATGVGSYLQFIASSGGQWYKLLSTDELAGGGAISSVAGVPGSLQYNKSNTQDGANAFWDNGSKTLYFGSNNDVTNADVVMSSSQIRSSGIYPFLMKLDNGNYFVLTKEGKVGINTPSLPIYESSPHFHVVGRCAVFEGVCGAGGVALTLYNNPQVVPASGSIGGSVNLAARNSNRNVVNFAQIQSKVLNPTKGETLGQFLVNVDVSGQPKNLFRVDNKNISLGSNYDRGSNDGIFIGINNSGVNLSNVNIFGPDNNIENCNNVFVMGSGNSIDFIKNSVKFILDEPNIQILSGLEWVDLEDMLDGDIVKVENNGTLNGYYVASSGTWTELNDDSAVAYLGTSNLMIGSENKLSGNNLIVFGNNVAASGNNLSVFGNYNDISTQTIQQIISSDLNYNTATVIGEYNSITASGLIVLGNQNAISGVSSLWLSGSNNEILEGSIDSLVLGNDNSYIVQSGVSIGSNNIGTFYDTNVLGGNNSINGDTNVVAGNRNTIAATGSLIFGNNNTANGFYGHIIGYDCSTDSTKDILIGTNISTSGNNNIIFGDTVSISGMRNTVFGSNIVLHKESYDLFMASNDVESSGIVNSGVIIGNHVSIDHDEYGDISVFGNTNTISSGINNICIIGANNTLSNKFDFTAPVYEFSDISLSGLQFTTPATSEQASGLLNIFRAEDSILVISTSDESVYTTGNIRLSYYNEDTGAFTIETEVALTGFTTSFMSSITYQEEVLTLGSKPVLIFGNKNNSIGLSGIMIGDMNYASGTNNYLIGNDLNIIGNQMVSIANKTHASGVNNGLAIGFNNTGSFSGSITIGINNDNYSNSHMVFGHNNDIGGNNTVVGHNNIIADRNSIIAGNSNIVLGKTNKDANIVIERDVYDRLINTDFSTDNAISVGKYLPDNGGLFLPDQSIIFDVYDKVVIQLIYENKYLPTYAGIITRSMADNNTAIYCQSTIVGSTDILNEVTLYDFIDGLFDTTPTSLSGFITIVKGNNQNIVGDNNKVVAASNINIVGSDNQFNINVYGINPIESGIVIGSHNKVFTEFVENGNTNNLTNLTPVTGVYNNAKKIFQGALGFNIRNTDPNSIKIGNDRSTLKIFDYGGKSNTQRIFIVDPNVNPPETAIIPGELIGVSGFANRGVIFNAEADMHSLYVLNSGENTEPVFSVISTGQGSIGIRTSEPDPQYAMDVYGALHASNITATGIVTNQLVMTSGARTGYYLRTKNNYGDLEFVAGVRVDVSGAPGSLLYFSGNPDTGKVQPMSTLVNMPTTEGNRDFLLNYIGYEPSGVFVEKSGLFFERYSSIDKYAVMTLDEHRRPVLGYPIEDVQEMSDVNPGRIDYVGRLKDWAKYKQQVDEAHYIPRQYNALYFIPESAQYVTTIQAGQALTNTDLELARQAKESIFVVGRRDAQYSKPIDLDRGEDVDDTNNFFPGGLASPQIVLSTIPKKDTFGLNDLRAPQFKFNYLEMLNPHSAPYYDGRKEDNISGGFGSTLFDNIRPLKDGDNQTTNTVTYQSWWYYDVNDTSAGSRPIDGIYSTISRAVPTIFNADLKEIDFVIYGTGTKYRDPDTGEPELPSKFVAGGIADFIDWQQTGLGETLAKFPFATTIPAVYYNASVGTLMLHTDHPSWLPIKIPDNQCEPCNPAQSGILFADLTVRGFIATSGIRLGQGFRRAFSVNEEGQTILAVDEKNKPIYESTEGMILTCDKFGMGVWQQLGGIQSTNEIIDPSRGDISTAANIQSVEGPLDPVTNATIEYAYETSNNIDTARLYRNTTSVQNENLLVNQALRLRGVTRNTLLFAKNPRPNALDNYTDTFNSSALPTSPFDQNIDGTENLFYYGYTNALDGVLSFNNDSNTTEVVVDGDASKRVRSGDMLRLLYQYDKEVDGQIVTVRDIVIHKAIGVNLLSTTPDIVLTDTDIGGPRTFSTRTHIVLDSAMSNVASATYNADRDDPYRRVAVISMTIGGYLTFNFPGESPDVVLSNRPGINTEFNANGKDLGFTIYGKKAQSFDTLTTVFNVDTVTNSIQINSSTVRPYGYTKKVVENISELNSKDINSEIYYNYSWSAGYLNGDISNTKDNMIITSSGIPENSIKIGDIVEVIYNTYHKINMYVTTVSATNIGVSLKKISYGLSADQIGNFNSGNTAVKFKVIKRTLPTTTVTSVDSNGETSTTVIGSGNIPIYSQMDISGVVSADHLYLHSSLGMDDTPNSLHPILFNKYGLITKSNLGYFDYKNNSYLVFKKNLPDIIDINTNIVDNVEIKEPIFADSTWSGNIKVDNLHVNNFSKFNTIDAGTTVFRGRCDNFELVCDNP